MLTFVCLQVAVSRLRAELFVCVIAKAPWTMEDNIFNFNDQPALRVQSSGVCSKLYEHYVAVLEHEVAATFRGLRTTLEGVKRIRKDLKVTWMAPYGCAILVQNLDVLSSRVTVVGLGGWEDTVHAYIHNREATATPDIVRPAILEVGAVRKDLYKEVVAQFNELMQQAKLENTRQKHHKTPTFVWARLLDAMVKVSALSSSSVAAMRETYQGGTTDVGTHTSCLERNTSFPLVASVFSVMLYLDEFDKNHDAFRKTLCVYYMHHLRYGTTKLVTT
jgi:hypothetical protein